MENFAPYVVSGGLVVAGTVLAQEIAVPEGSPWWVVLLAPVVLIVAQVLKSYINTKVSQAAEEKKQKLAQDFQENKTLLSQLSFQNEQIASLVAILANMAVSVDEQVSRAVSDRADAREMAKKGHDRLDEMQTRLDNIHATMLDGERLHVDNHRLLEELPEAIVSRLKKEIPFNGNSN